MAKKTEVKEDFSNTTSVDIRSIDKKEVVDEVALKKDNTKVFFVILAIVTILVSLIGSYLIVRFTKGNVARPKAILDYKNISIKDEGISAPVLKVYDSVVVVETYVNDKLYATGMNQIKLLIVLQQLFYLMDILEILP